MNISRSTNKLFLQAACVCLHAGLVMYAQVAGAQTLPGSADSSRIAPDEFEKASPARPSAEIEAPAPPIVTPPPPQAKSIQFELKDVRIHGMSAFTQDQIKPLYEAYINKSVTLDVAWSLADAITQMYRKEQYFLSRAYVPEQSIEDGVLHLNIVEGYIAEIKMANEPEYAVRVLLDSLKSHRPLSAGRLESAVLRLNDITGINYFGTLQKNPSNEEGGVTLVLEAKDKKTEGLFAFNNYGSRYLGPYQGVATYKTSILPLSQTQVSVSTSLPAKESRYFGLSHSVFLLPSISLDMSGSHSVTRPGASLTVSDIKSSSSRLSAGLSWHIKRQRKQNLIASLKLNMSNSNGDILSDQPLTRDRLRALEASLYHDSIDRFGGVNSLNLSLTRGLRLLGASAKGADNLSREDASPDATRLSFEFTRAQPLPHDFMMVMRSAAQISSAPLLSSDEFGYGGAVLGRAYDASEILGDRGIAGGVELHYFGVPDFAGRVSASPYVFYDIGYVSNTDTGGGHESGASAGLGMSLRVREKMSGNIGVAWPLTREVSEPLYGDEKSPRWLLNLAYTL